VGNITGIRNLCGTRYTPEPKPQGYSREVRMAAIRLYVDGINLRRIGRQLGVNHQSVANWVKAYVAQLPPASQPEKAETMEMDELHSWLELAPALPSALPELSCPTH
jgi:transposase-like protein